MVACPPNGVDVFAQFNGKAVYKDFVQSYSTVEPAIDLTASSPLAFAWQIAGAPSGTAESLDRAGRSAALWFFPRRREMELRQSFLRAVLTLAFGLAIY